MSAGVVIAVHVSFDSACRRRFHVRPFYFAAMSSAVAFAERVAKIPGVREVKTESPRAIMSAESAFEFFTAERI